MVFKAELGWAGGLGGERYPTKVSESFLSKRKLWSGYSLGILLFLPMNPHSL